LNFKKWAGISFVSVLTVKFDQMSSSGLGGVALTIYDWHSEWITIPTKKQQPLFVG
jgi:hypothetical protein